MTRREFYVEYYQRTDREFSDKYIWGHKQDRMKIWASMGGFGAPPSALFAEGTRFTLTAERRHFGLRQKR
jgi:hypothetical protein